MLATRSISTSSAYWLGHTLGLAKIAGISDWLGASAPETLAAGPDVTYAQLRERGQALQEAIVGRAQAGGTLATPEQVGALRRLMKAKHVPILTHTLTDSPDAAYITGTGTKTLGAMLPGGLTPDDLAYRRQQAEAIWQKLQGGTPRARQFERGFVVSSPDLRLDTTAHEFGHATGRGKLLRYMTDWGRNVGSPAYRTGSRAAELAGLGAASPRAAVDIGGHIGAMRGSIEGLGQLPEEIRASLRALQALKNTPGVTPAQLRAARRGLAAAAATYVNAATVSGALEGAAEAQRPLGLPGPLGSSRAKELRITGKQLLQRAREQARQHGAALRAVNATPEGRRFMKRIGLTLHRQAPELQQLLLRKGDPALQQIATNRPVRHAIQRMLIALKRYNPALLKFLGG